MADSFVQGRKLYVGARDLSGDWTTINLRSGRAPVEFTRGADSGTNFKPGLRMTSLEAEGITNLGTDLADDVLPDFVDLSDTPIIVAPTTGLTGEPAYGFLAEMGDFSPINGATIGGRLNFTVSARASDSKLVRGIVGWDAATEITATADGTAYEMGAVAAGKKLYACLMVLSATGTSPTLDVVVAGDTLEAFSDTPADHVTFTQANSAGDFEWKEVAGAIADTWFRVEVTVGGTDDPTFEIVVLLAIA